MLVFLGRGQPIISEIAQYHVFSKSVKAVLVDYNSKPNWGTFQIQIILKLSYLKGALDNFSLIP